MSTTTAAEVEREVERECVTNLEALDRYTALRLLALYRYERARAEMVIIHANHTGWAEEKAAVAKHDECVATLDRLGVVL